MKNLLAIDATWVIRRNFHMQKLCVVKDAVIDEETGEVIEPAIQDPNKIKVSFLQSILKYMREYNYEYEVVCLFDRGTWRYRPKEKYTDYKSGRDYSSDLWQCLWDSTDEVIAMLRGLGIKVIQVSGCEADDLGMYYAHNHGKDKCVLITSDRDWFLAVNETTEIHRPVKGSMEVTTYSDLIDGEVIKKPFHLAVQKAIDGDGSDNIAGFNIDMDLKDIIEIFDSNYDSFPVELKQHFDKTLPLAMLNRILTDDEVISQIKIQENMHSQSLTRTEMLEVFNQYMKDWPVYFIGVMQKYLSGLGALTK